MLESENPWATKKETEHKQKTLFLLSPARAFRYRDPSNYTISHFCWEDIEIVEMDVNPENEFTRETVVPILLFTLAILYNTR